MIFHLPRVHRGPNYLSNLYSYKSFFYDSAMNSILYWVPDLHEIIRIGQK